MSSDNAALFKKPDIAKLNEYYNDGDTCDTEVFAEMRSGVLLHAGEHYNRKQSRFYKRIRDSRELSQEQKLRLTKNHTRKICQLYANNIMSANPGVGFTPKDENSNHDMKVAELHHSVWKDAVERYDLDDKMDDWCDSFIQIGECAVKIFFDPHLGNLKGYQPQIDEATGQAAVDPGTGQPVDDKSKPLFSGEFVFEEVYGFNLLRPAECKDMRKAEWLCIRKMANKADLMRQFADNEEIQRFIQPSNDETFVVFDGAQGGYKKTTKQTMIREYYFRPSQLFPEGYFYITTKEGIIAEGPLPGGIFPIVFMPFDKIQTTPRGRSPIKTMRPYQAEINRAASKIAEHQITLGDDKLLIQNGTKVSAGTSLPGIRSVSYTGMAPTILEGRNGAQYLEYMNTQITEMYAVLNVSEDSEQDTQNLDPYVLLYRAARAKKKFQRYIKRFEKFLIEVVKTYLKLAKVHMSDDEIVYAIGTNEQVNIPEFRKLPDICYEINVEAQSDDIETKLGKQIVINHALQYVGSQLKPENIGQIMRQMPFANVDGCFDDLTIDYDSTENDILALDRGEQPPVGQYDNHLYSIKRLTARMRKADFKYLAQPIQMSYQQKVDAHQQMEAANQASLQRAEQGFIPTGGYAVKCDFYTKDPSDPTGNKIRRAVFPYQSIEWLAKQLEAQGQSQDSLQNMNGGAAAQLADKVSAQAGQPGAQQGMGSPNGMGGAQSGMGM